MTRTIAVSSNEDSSACLDMEPKAYRAPVQRPEVRETEVPVGVGSCARYGGSRSMSATKDGAPYVYM